MVSPPNFAQVRDSNNIRVHSHVTIYAHSWLKSWNISMASEGKQRELAKEITDGIIFIS